MTLLRPQIHGYVLDGYNIHWITVLLSDLNITAIYLARVCEKMKAMDAICINARMSECIR